MNNFAMEMAESHFITTCNQGVTYDLLYQQTHLLCVPLILQDSKGVLRKIYFVNYPYIHGLSFKQSCTSALKPNKTKKVNELMPYTTCTSRYTRKVIFIIVICIYST